MTSIADPLSRQQLYELVWREPMLKVAQRFGVSSSYLARVCTELRVPRPERGYWAKLEHGKKPSQPALPPLQAGGITEWKPGATIGTTQRTAVRRRKAREVLATTGEPAERGHELLVGVRSLFLKSRSTDAGLLRPFKRHLVDIVTSEKNLDAALAAADALFRALESKGYSVVLGSSNRHSRRAEVDEREVPVKHHYRRAVWSPDRLTVVRIGEVEYGLTLFEMTEPAEMMYMGSNTYVPVRDLTPEQLRRCREPRHWRTTRDYASGRFALQAYATSGMVQWVQRWQESKDGQFTSMVARVVKELEAAVPELGRKQQEAEVRAAEEQRQREEQWRRHLEEAERARRARARQDARQDLLASIASWEQTRSIHAYFEAVERQLQQLSEEEQERLRERLNEARALVGELDALAQLKQWRSPQERVA